MICCTIETETVKQKGSHVRQFHTYNQAVYYLYNELPKTPRLVQDPQAKIEQNKRIMQVLGNPQDAHPSVHVAGTSGKGTICYLVDAILRAHTKHTGLLQSPHVYDIRERVQLNGQLVSERQFLEYLHIAIHAFQAENVQITLVSAADSIEPIVSTEKINLPYWDKSASTTPKRSVTHYEKWPAKKLALCRNITEL